MPEGHAEAIITSNPSVATQHNAIHAARQIDDATLPASEGLPTPPSCNRPAALEQQPVTWTARDQWQANRISIDAPHWFGLSSNDSDALDPEEEDNLLPLRFGIVVGANRGATAPGAGLTTDTFESERSSSVITFPPHVPEAPAAPRRSPGILRFRALAARRDIAIFSLAGGVGGTSLAAAMARVLASCGERVLLADARDHSLMARYFGGNGARQGVVRRFAPPPDSHTATVSIISLDVAPFTASDDEQDRILHEFNAESSNADRVVWDLGNAPVDWCLRIMRQGLRVIVPLLPTAKCLMQLGDTERLLQVSRRHPRSPRWQFVLNQYDDRDPAHVQIRSQFRKQLGDRLLPFVLRNSPLVNEALLGGKTIIDHAPACPLVLDLWRLVRSIAGLAQPYPEFRPEIWSEN